MKSEKGILILGAGIMQLPAIKIAKEMGWFVAAADGNGKAEAASWADIFFTVDLKDREGLFREAERLRRNRALDGIFTAGTDFSATVAWLSEKLSLPGIPLEAAINASDKGKMRKRFLDAGLPSPRYKVLLEGEEGDLSGFSFPLVVKPADSMGARGVVRIDSENELGKALEEAYYHSGSKKAVVEEYVEGPEFSLDALVYNQEFYPCGCADRHISLEPFFVELGHTMPSVYPKETLRSIWEVFEKGSRALGITCGAAKGDIKLSVSGPVIGEIAARLSGGYMSGWTYPYASGRDVTKGALRIAVGLPPDLPERDMGFVSAERAFISIPGTIAGYSGLREAERIKGVKNVFVLKTPGSAVEFPTNNVKKCGNIISQEKTREEAVKSAEKAVGIIVPHLVPGDARTREFLFSQNKWPSPAFMLESSENRKVFDSMPRLLLPERSFPLPSRQIPLGIISLPNTGLETSVDWLKRGFEDSLAVVFSKTGVCFSADPEVLRLGKLFWICFLKGGVQGGLWIIETVRDLLSDKKGLERVLGL